MRLRYRTILPLLAALPLLAGCASAGGRAASMEIPVHVQNDLTNRGDITVRMVADDGFASVLGGAPPASGRRFVFRTGSVSGSYQLTATTGDGRVIRSRPFTLFEGAAVLWELQRNVLQVIPADMLDESYYPGGSVGGGHG